MSTTASGTYHQPMVAMRRKKAYGVASFSLAATTGVATLIDTDDSPLNNLGGITLTRSAAGTYALTYPAAAGPNGRVHVGFELLNTFDNVASITGARLSAKAPSLGTATVKIYAGNSGLAADPGASDVVTLQIAIAVDCNS